MRPKYAIFQGGGIKGLALVGALARFEEEGIDFDGFAGTSAGAIVAALSSMGVRASQANGTDGSSLNMQTILGEMANFGNLLEVSKPGLSLEEFQTILQLPEVLSPQSADKDEKNAAEAIRYWGRLKELAANCDILIESPFSLRGLRAFFRMLWLAPASYRRLKLLWRVVRQVMQHKGVFESSKFLEWIRKYMGLANGRSSREVTFETVSGRGKALTIVATDLELGRVKTFNLSNTRTTEVARAVVASMSIPLFFKPCQEFADGFLIDGGVIANFPLWAFDTEIKSDRNENKPVAVIVGFRLVPSQRDSTRQGLATFDKFARALWNTMIDGTDAFHTDRTIDSLANNLVMVNITVPSDISATRLNLADEERQLLFKKGYFAAEVALANTDNRRLLNLPEKQPKVNQGEKTAGGAS
jgi:NTE family protein